MRHAFSSHSDVVHRFANLNPEEIESGYGYAGNISFRNGSIFSYGSHFEMAHYDKDIAGNPILVVSTRSYSVSTSQHQSALSSATRHHKRIFVPHSDSPSSSIRDWKYDLKQLNAKLAKARKPELYIGQIDSLREQIETAFREYYGQPIPLELAELLEMDAEQLASLRQPGSGRQTGRQSPSFGHSRERDMQSEATGIISEQPAYSRQLPPNFSQPGAANPLVPI
jgi:hypothetical protein